jgi:hypothetical protein
MQAKLGRALLTFLPLFGATIESKACIRHWLAGEWPPHAIFHTLMGLGGLLATYALILILVWIPLRRGERWAWFAIGLAVLIALGGLVVSDFVTGGGLRNYTVTLGSGATVYTGLLVALALYGVGLALTWSSTRRG